MVQFLAVVLSFDAKAKNSVCNESRAFTDIDTDFRIFRLEPESVDAEGFDGDQE